MRRREFLGALGCAAATWPSLAKAQQRNTVRRVGVLTGAAGPDSIARVEVFLQALAQLGWTKGENIQFEIRQGSGSNDAIRKHAAELAELAPDVIMTIGGTATGFLLQATRTVPIVFTIVPDPVGSGFIDSLSRPGGNATGFLQFEYSFGGKWVELLREIGPEVVRAAVLRDARLPAGVGQFAVIQSVAPSLGIEVTPVNVRDAAEIERDVSAFARATKGGLIVASSTSALINRDMIIALAARHKLPAVYAQREFVTAGGLLSYSADFSAQFRSAASYVDRILKGEKPGDLAVQGPTNYQLVINLKTAKAFGLNIPPALLVRADEVIE
jgi:putative ABC transport system substrate-binding protein